MNKKILCTAIACLLLVSLCGCGMSGGTNPTASPDVSPAVSDVIPDVVPDTMPETEDGVVNDTDGIITDDDTGTEGNIIAGDNDLKPDQPTATDSGAARGGMR